MSIQTLKEKIINIAQEYDLQPGLSLLEVYYNTRKENAEKITLVFSDLFTKLTKDFLNKLSLASNYYFYSISIIDTILDEKKDKLNQNSLLLSFVLREKSLRIMYNLFPTDNIFWKYFDKYYSEYIQAITFEINFKKELKNNYSIKKIEKIYSGKGAFLKAATTAMAIKNENIPLIKPLEKSIDYYLIALGFYDDVNDWKQDWKNHQFNHLIENVLITGKLKRSDINNEKELGKYIFFSGEAITSLKFAISYYKKAIITVKDVSCEFWKNSLIEKIKTCKLLIEDIQLIINKELLRTGIVHLKNKKDLQICENDFSIILKANKKTFKLALYHLIRQWNNGFIDACVYTYFSENDKFLFKKRFYTGDVFQRAIILDILYDINPLINNKLTPILIEEINYLQKQISENGWWNYYHDMEYHACDIDTTSQVLQCLIKTNNPILAKTKKSIELFINWNKNKNGKIGTWFIPPTAECTEKQILQKNFFKQYINLNIDKSNDIEVIANFLYTLHIFEPLKYKHFIQKGLDILEKEQNRNGSWNTSWYWGNLYGIYVCHRAFSNIRPKSESIKYAIEFIYNTQNKDGGWGWKIGISDPLNTAFALIVLMSANKNNIVAINRGVNYLHSSIENKEHLNRCNFINFQTKKISAFKSYSITMAYILKALSLFIK